MIAGKYVVKVCGMRDMRNMEALIDEVGPELIGFIFYERSPRYTVLAPPTDEGVERVGVFVDSDLSMIRGIVKENSLDWVQLHGKEEPSFCRELREDGLKVMKAFRVGNELPVDQLKDYQGSVDRFLFDTLGDKHGGTGKTFNWRLLESYELDIPYLVGGGLGPDNISELLSLELPGMVGIDLNSSFETSPGLKDVKLLKQTLEEL